jgi:hypothetical protein
MQTVGSMLAVLPAQVALFGVLWWHNSKQILTRAAERAASAGDDQAMRRERVRLAHEAADRRAKEAADRDRTV